ncbi:LAME_0E11584g1_1 [Lachancea meyersii CBS 8951]|uniref:Inositol-pentakisphosphate 2-kinase n=1 Tax=Lachancea meyersii CBS 8951 TaxID=1266667 RepID=A0A1G4JLH9_9SACH|nr:LAME_0E11584g1_1 [Lachancea meyersii CBS 8951]
MTTESDALSDAILVNHGNANIIIGYADKTDRLERCCVRFRSLEHNNIYTLENLQFIKNEVFPLLDDFLITVKKIERNVNCLATLLTKFKVDLDSKVVQVLEMENLTYGMNSVVTVDHFTKVHRNVSSDCSRAVVWEFKPKWLAQYGENCRNCALNRMKGRDISYCYNMVLSRPKELKKWFSTEQLPSQFFSDMEKYFENPKNVLATLYGAQRKLRNSVPPLTDLTSQNDVSDILALLMTLRDVTCFVRWDPQCGISAKIVDVDSKPKSKWSQWKAQQEKLNASGVQVFH